MSTTSQNSASSRISALLDDNSFVEIGGSVTARNTDFNLQNKETPADGVLTCLLYTSPSPRDRSVSRMPSSA